MSTKQPNRSENNFIRGLFAGNDVRYYNDLRVNGRRRVFKSLNTPANRRQWKDVLGALSLTVHRNKWSLWASADKIGIVCFQEQ